EKSGSTVPSILNRMQTNQTPPTYNKTNKFTSGFQNIVESYGIGSYREINPAPYTIITFPFLFAVMFGDLGHGTLMTCAALYLVLRESRLMAQKNDNEIWSISINKLTFLNSFKMKMSVILGVTHMLFGVSLSLFNHLYFKKPLNIYFGFIPEIVFMSSLFGYLVILIFYKWVSYDARTSRDAPKMCMMHQQGSWYFGFTGSKENNASTNLEVFHLQYITARLLVTNDHARKPESSFVGLRTCCNHVLVLNLVLTCLYVFPQFNFADVAVHQAIHTIEYCLGCISNTASYLRLWALSLAHARKE
ncbi:hypothetical protein GOODEAATRI_022092, partial [Goodea atripinnis]